MAPLSLSDDLDISSLELDSRASTDPIDLPQYLEFLSLPEREALNEPPPSSLESLFKRSSTPTSLSPMELHNVLTARSASTATRSSNPGVGSIEPSNINMKAIQAVFALIGASMVLGAIWFFFWAKNGGFHFRKGDWDDYKSTVLRRKGPDGKTLSNATKSTKLGGGSIMGTQYQDWDDEERSTGMTEISKTISQGTRVTGLTGGSAFGAGKRIKKMRERMAEKKARKAAATNLKKHVKETEKQGRKRTARTDPWEGAGDADVEAYRHEKPARVGGLNKSSDGQGTFYGGTEYSETDTSYTPSHAYASSRHNNRASHSRHNSPEKQPASRHSRDSTNYRSSPRNSPRHTPRQGSPVKPSHQRNRSSMPGSYADPLDFSSDYGSHTRSVADTESDTGTKSYHHPIPGLSSGGGNKGYRRGRRDSLDD